MAETSHKPKKIPKISKTSKTYYWDNCNKSFTDRSNRYRHQKFYCKTSKQDGNSIDPSPNPKNFLEIVDLKQQINELTRIVKNNIIKGNNPITTVNIEHQNIQNNITIYVTEKIDFVQALQDRYGWTEARAIRHIKERISQDNNGDVDLFCDIYLVGKKEDWPIICQDEKKAIFLIKDSNNNLIRDPGGFQLHQNFKKNYTDTLLRLTNRELNKVIDHKVGTPDFEVLRDDLMDNFDLQMVQTKTFSLCKMGPDQFVKSLMIRVRNAN